MNMTFPLTRDEAAALVKVLPKTVQNGSSPAQRVLFRLAAHLYAALDETTNESDASHRDDGPTVTR